MNRKGQAAGIGMFLAIFIGVIVGLILFQASVDQAAGTLNSVYAANKTYTLSATTQDLIGQELLDTPVMTNATGGELISSTNYTIFEGISSTTGLKTVKMTGTPSALWTGKSVNISWTYGPNGYIEDTGSRSIVGLIAIFAALAVATVALVPTLRSGILEMVGRNI